jgi:hypothetical protein
MVVKENIDFKRGQSSRDALDIGMNRKIHPPFKWEDMPSSMYLLKDEDDMYNIMFWNQAKKLGKLSDGTLSPQKSMSLELLYEVDNKWAGEWEDTLSWAKMIETPQHLIEQGYPE